MQCMHAGSIAAAPARLARLAELAVDPRWLHRFKLVIVHHLFGAPQTPSFFGQVAAARFRSVAQEALAAPSVDNATFAVSKKESADHAHWKVETGRDRRTAATRYYANAKWRMPEDASGESMAAEWIELQHAILETIGATQGVIVTATNAWVMHAELFFETASVDGKQMHPHPEEISSYRVNRDQLGEQYVRKPRWGTYLKPAHVAAVGGREKILAVVRPPVVRDVGDLLYVQLSERVADATAPATLERWRAFADLLAPITMPALQP
jgi:hypothetical protein